MIGRAKKLFGATCGLDGIFWARKCGWIETNKQASRQTEMTADRQLRRQRAYKQP